MRLRHAVKLSLLALLPLWAGAHAACAGKKGGLMLAINTDMKAPKDVNIVSVHIQTGSAVKHNFIGRVTPDGEVLLPATLAIAEPDDPNQSIRVRVVAFQENKPRVLRDVRTTVPRDGRIALLRIPLAFVNDGISVSGSLPTELLPPKASGGPVGATDAGANGDGGNVGKLADEFNPYDPTTSGVTPGCADPDQTYIDGTCQDSFVDSSTLPDFSEEAVFGPGGLGACFDAKRCFADAAPLAVEGGATCRVTLGAGANPASVNLALVTRDTGECITPGKCFVPLDQGDGGWKAEGNVVQLPPSACALVGRGAAEVYASLRACPAKTVANPACADTSPVVPPPSGEQVLVMKESFVTDFALAGPFLIVAGDAGGGVLRLDVPPDSAQRIGVTGLPAGSGRRSWIVAENGPIAAISLLGTTSPTTVVLTDARNDFTSPLETITQLPSDTPLTDFAFGPGGEYLWTFGDQGRGGVYFQLSAAGPPQPLTPPGNVAATAIAAIPGTPMFVFGDEKGNLTECDFGQLPPVCQPPEIAVQGKRIDSIAPLFVPGGGGVISARDSGIYRVTPGDPGNTYTRLAADSIDGLGVEGGTLRRRIAATSRCAFYAIGNDVRWVTLDGAQRGDLVRGASPTSSVFTFEGAPDVFYSVYASIADGGGVYVTPVPPACAGSVPGDGGAPIGDGG
jgi:hypothetical protein